MRLRKKIVLAGGITVGIILLIFLILHTPIVRNKALHIVQKNLLKNGIILSTDSFKYNLFNLKAQLENVELHSSSNQDLPAFFSADEISIQVPWKVIWGKKIEIKNLEVIHPHLNAQFTERGVSNLPSGNTKSQSTSEPFQMPDIKIKKAAISGARLTYQNSVKKIDAVIDGIGIRINWTGDKTHTLVLNKNGAGTIVFRNFQQKLEDFQLGLRIQDNGIDIEKLNFSAGENEITYSGYLHDFASPEIYGKASGRMNWKDICAFITVPEDPSGYLNFDLELRGNKEQGYQAAAVLKNHSSYFRGLEETDVNIKVHWKDDVLTVASMRIDPGEGYINGEGKLSITESLDTNYFDLSWKGIDLTLLQPWLSQPIPVEALTSGKVKINWKKLTLDDVYGQADIEFNSPKSRKVSKNLPLNAAIKATLNSGAADVVLQRMNIAETDISGDLHLVKNQVSGKYRIETKGISESLTLLDPLIPDKVKNSLKQVSPGGSIQLSGTIKGKWPDPSIQIKMKGKDIAAERFSGLHLEGEADLDLNKKKADINYIKIIDKDMSLDISGKLPFDTIDEEIDIAVTLKKLPVQKITAAMNLNVDASALIDLSANIKGKITDPIVTLSLSTDQLTGFNQEFGKIDLAAGYEKDRLSVDFLRFQKDDAKIDIKGFYDIKKQTFLWNLDTDSFPLDNLILPGSKDVIKGNVNFEVQAKGSLSSPLITAKIFFHGLEYAGFKIGEIHLNGQSDFNGFNAAAIFSDFNTLIKAWIPRTILSPAARTGQIEEPWRPAEISIETGNLDFYRLMSLIPFIDQENIKGIISTRIYLFSDEWGLEGLSGNAEIKIAGLEIRNIPVYQENPFEITLKEGKLGFRNLYLRGKEAQLKADGSIDIFKDGQMDLDVLGDVDLGVFKDLLEEGELSGKIHLSTHISNTISAPDIRGEIALEQINFLLPYPGILIRNINGNMEVNPQKIVIKDISGDFNGGKLNVNGGATLAGVNWSEAEINMRFNNIWMDLPMGFNTRVNSNLIFSLNQEKSTLNGEVWLSDTLFTENFSVQSTLFKYLKPSPVRISQSHANHFLDTLDLNLKIRTDTNIKIENNIANSELKADLILNGTARRPSLAGRALIEQGEIYFTGNTFVIEEGVIDFINPDQIEPYLNLKAQTKVNEYDILLIVTGPLSKLSASMSSDPALKQVDIISLLVTGRTLDSASASALDIAGNEVLTYLNNALTGRIENVVKDVLGLDSVKIDAGLVASQENPNSRLTLGQNLSRKLKLIYSQDMKDARNQTWIIDYYPFKRLDVQGIKRDNNTYSLGVKHNIVFGGKSGEDPVFERGVTSRKNKVSNIVFLGDSRFIPEIQSLLSTKKGRLFDFYTFHKDLKKIRNFFVKSDYLEHTLESFQDIKADNSMDLTIKFDPGPRVSFRFSGASFSQSKVNEIKKIWSQAGTEQFAVREITKYLRTYFIKKKYYRADIQVKEVSTSKEQKLYAVIITKGLKYKSINTSYSGNQFFSPARLDKIIKQKDFIQELLLYPANFKKNLQQYLTASGFLDAKVREVKVEFDPDAQEMFISLSMFEGKRYEFGRIISRGNRFFSDDAINNILALKEGSVFSYDQVSQQTMKIREEYNRKGFNNVRIDSQILPNADTGRIDLSLEISENQKAIISDIKISGFRHTKEYAIRRELEFQIDDIVDFRKINSSRKNLYDLGIFEYVDIEVLPDEKSVDSQDQIKPGDIPEKPFMIHVIVYENHPYQFKYGLEYSTETSFGISGEIRDVNWTGYAHLIGSSFRYNQDEKDLRFFYRSFYFLRKKINSEIFSFANRVQKPGFIMDSVGFTFQQQAKLGSSYLLTYNFTLEKNRILDKDPFLELSGDQNVNIGTFSLGMIRDTRNNILDPMGGMFFSHNLEYAPGILGTGIKYFRYFGQNYFYIPVVRSIIYAVGLRMGLSQAHDQEMPLSKRFFAGGSSTVRGFEKNELGDKDPATGLALGGEAIFILNQELRIPLIKKIKGALFFDMGNVYPSLSAFNLSEMREAAGFGLRYHSPYFLIRFDWGFVLDLLPGEKRSRIYFSIGQSF